MAHEELSPLNITPGAIRFNTDSMKLEYFRIGMEGGSTSSYAGIGTMAAGEWVQLTTDSPEVQTGGARGVFMGGYIHPAFSNVIDYITISTTGDALDFGDLSVVRGFNGQVGSRTRGVAGGGESAGATQHNVIDYVTIASTGDAIDFGDLTVVRETQAGCGSDTRGLFGGGITPTHVNTIDYVTIAQTGNAVDFGDLINTPGNPAALSSSTRGIFAGGNDPTSPNAGNVVNTIQYVIISTLGNTANFGDLTLRRRSLAGCSNSTRGLFGGGAPSPTTNIIDYITIATLGDALDFGDLVANRANLAGCASPTRGVFAGGQFTNVVQYVQIMSKGDAQDFGDLTSTRGYISGLSNGHGGLG